MMSRVMLNSRASNTVVQGKYNSARVMRLKFSPAVSRIREFVQHCPAKILWVKFSRYLMGRIHNWGKGKACSTNIEFHRQKHVHNA